MKLYSYKLMADVKTTSETIARSLLFDVLIRAHQSLRSAHGTAHFLPETHNNTTTFCNTFYLRIFTLTLKVT